MPGETPIATSLRLVVIPAKEPGSSRRKDRPAIPETALRPFRDDDGLDHSSAGSLAPSHFSEMAFSAPSALALVMMALTFSSSAGSFLLRPI